MYGIYIDPEIMVHRLSLHPTARLVRHKRRIFSFERNWAEAEEIDKLLQAQFYKESVLS
jgi:hypothetical protein